jgi:primosomal protein N' (replication factor Y)
LLVQAVGRAGRGDKMGEAIIQTYSPEHYAIVAAAAQDYDAFYEQEISYRACMGYPPVDHLMALHVAGEDLQRVEMGCKYLHEYAKRMKKEFEIVIIGPASPGVSKIKDVHRRVLYFKAERYALLVWMKNCLEKYIEVNVGFSSMQIQFDFDPMQMG